MDAITLLKNDHRDVEKLFKRFEATGDRAFSTKRGLVDKMIEQLSRHAAVEEQLFYPVTRATVPGTDDIVLESIEEHHIVKWELSELQHLDPDDERFDAKVTVLIESVRHHVEEEETVYFPKVRSEIGRKALDDLGETMSDAKAHAPTHPHPRSPQTPPGNLAAGSVAGAVDRVTDTVSGVAQGGLAAATDLVDRFRGKKTARSAPQGSSIARSTAQKARGTNEQALDQAIEAVRSATLTGAQKPTQVRSKTRKTRGLCPRPPRVAPGVIVSR